MISCELFNSAIMEASEMDVDEGSEISQGSIPSVDEDEENCHVTTVSACHTFYDVDCERVLLTLAHPYSLHFNGCVSVVSLAGHVDVNGFIIKPGMESANVFSLTGSSASYFQTTDSSSCSGFNISDLYGYGFSLMGSTKIMNSVNEKGCILLLTKIKSPVNLPKNLLPFKYPEKCQNLSRPERTVNLSIERPGYTIPNKLKIVPLLKGHHHERTIVCGGKGVGKSTTLRYLINECLNSYPEVLYLDFDIGQPEFTMPECISAVSVTKPLLAPNYCTFKEPLYSYYIGDTDVTKNIESYKRGVETLIAKCEGNECFKKIPWLINTMGFPKGIGVLLTSSIISCVKPTLLIQFRGKKAQNFPDTLSAQYVYDMCNETIPSYPFILVDTPNKTAIGSAGELLSNKQTRWFRILSYFNNTGLPSKLKSISSDSISVMSAKNKTSISPELYKYLCSKIVTLSESSPSEENISNSGCAIIVGFNEVEKSFSLLTPLKVVDSIKTIWAGSLEIPSQINAILKPEDCGLIPYVQVGLPKAPALKPVERRFRFLFGKDNKRA